MASSRTPCSLCRLPFASLFAIIFLLFVMRLSVYAADDSATADHVIDTAIALRLYDDPAWLALGHYRHDGKGWKSTVDDPRFFLADKGKTDPRSELEATIRAFYFTGTNIEEHATSRFVARLAWIRAQCPLSDGEIPTITDTPYKRLLAEVRPTSIILAFPAPSADGISTAFGHVFLIFVHADRNPLLGPTVSYAALIDENGGILYPILGLTGGLKAYFTALSYAERLKEYNSIACRDMWEYELALAPDEVERIFQHAWEMRRIYSRYFFLGENCSYGVLALLDVARPGLCAPSFDRRPFILPLDVIRHVREQGLVKSARYVPSVLTSMRAQAQKLSMREVSTARAMAYGREAPANGLLINTNSNIQAAMLDVAMSLAQIRAAKGEEPAEEQQRIMGALIRSVPSVPAGQQTETTSVAPPFPETAHLPSRLSTGAVKRNDALYWAIAFRPVYHDLLDQSDAMDPGVQLQLFGTEVLVDKNGGIAEWQLCLFDMEALNPCDALYAPLSHRFKVNTIYRDDDLSTNQWNCVVEGGLGFSYALFARSIVYGMGEVELQTQTVQRDVWLGIGPAIGLTTDLPLRTRAFIEGRYQVNGIDSDQLRSDIDAGFSVSISKQISLVAQYTREKLSGEETSSEVRLDARIYF